MGIAREKREGERERERERERENFPTKSSEVQPIPLTEQRIEPIPEES